MTDDKLKDKFNDEEKKKLNELVDST